MFHSVRYGVLFAVLALGLSIVPAAGAEEKKADVEVKGCTAEIPSCTAEAKGKEECPKVSEKKGDEKSAQESTGEKDGGKKESSKNKNDNSTNNETGDIKIFNYGVQTIFINSNVQLGGGTISSEMTKQGNVAAPAPASEESKPPVKSGEGAPSQSSGAPKEEKPSKFDELIKDATKDAGMFTVYTRKDGKIYWEIKPENFEKNYLVSGILASGLGAGWMKPGTYLGGIVVQFRKIDEKIQLMQRNLRFIADDGSTEEKALEKNYKDSIIASFPVEATNPENSASMIEFGKFFLSDAFNLNPDVNNSLGGGYGFDAGNSYVKETKVFPENVVIRSLFAFRSGGMGGGALSVPSPGSAQLEVMVDVRTLKDNPDFKPRQADPRVGHFLEARMNFSDKNRSNLFVRNISRWDVRKASPELALSPPVKPIVVWLENTIPKKYRPAVRNGLLEWNKAFEKIGVKDALVVKEQPDDATWDISDARYNTIHWNESYSSAYSGVAQWVADPRNGEILHGSFLIEAETIRGLLNMQRYLEPDRVAMVKRHLNPTAPKQAGNQYIGNLFDNDLQESADQGIVGMTVLAARAGIENVSDETTNEFINQFLFWVICHEFGHVLGLRHNFEASTMLPLEDLHNKELTKEVGLTGSIMEYQPPNIAPEGTQQGYYYSPTIGQYDYLAIEYAYKEIKPATGETEESILNKIAEKAESPKFAYGTDEDLNGGSPYYGQGLDPLCNQFDLGNDPLAFAKQQTQMVLDTIPKLPKLVKDGDTYLMVRNAFNRLVGYYFDNTRFALKYIGGQYVTRTKKGGGYNRIPLEPVSAARQREAMNFLVETIFSDKLFQVDPEMLNMLAAEKWYHWGVNFSGASSEFPLSAVVQDLYDTVIYSIYSPAIMHRILDAEKQRSSGEASFTIPELFRRLKQGIWNEVYQETVNSATSTYTDKKPFLSTYRRILQREHLKAVIEIMLEPPSAMPDDARIQAWRTLADLDRQINRVLMKYSDTDRIDDSSRDHLSDSSLKIRRALDARVSARVDLW